VAESGAEHAVTAAAATARAASSAPPGGDEALRRTMATLHWVREGVR
jgi:hypothetical protein